ncbi:MAG: serine/threonine-protein kinase [Candidatus Acidiferrales bacterium]
MSQDYNVGQRLGDYEVLGVLGAGGMGKVYKVRNVISDRVEAMKILLPNLAGQKELADRFLREIKLLASLNNPNIAALRTALTVDDQLVMIMEYVEGVTLASLLHQGPVPVTDAVNYIDQVLGALTYAHHMNVIHRDIKPANMMLTPQGVVKLMDFGVARPGNEVGMTMTGTTLGSLNYMPPEQVKGEAADARSDLYSLGVSLYEIVTGRLPFRGDSNYSLMTAQLQEAPPPPISVRPDLPKALSDITLMALAKEPERRFQSATAFRTALKSVSGHPIDAPAATAFHAPPSPVVATRATTSAAQQPVAAAVASTQPPPPAAQKSHRGLYMALGALVVVAILAAAAVYVPHRAKTNAGAGSSSTSSAPADAPPPVANPPAPDAAAAAKDQAAAAQAAAQAAAAQAAADAAAKAAAAQAEAEAKAKAAALEEAEKQADQLSGRAAAVSQSLDNLKRQQAAQGYGLRGDMVASEQRMQINMARAEAALQKQDPAKAKEYLDLAGAEVETLERFLGR